MTSVTKAVRQHSRRLVGPTLLTSHILCASPQPAVSATQYGVGFANLLESLPTLIKVNMSQRNHKNKTSHHRKEFEVRGRDLFCPTLVTLVRMQKQGQFFVGLEPESMEKYETTGPKVPASPS